MENTTSKRVRMWTLLGLLSATHLTPAHESVPFEIAELQKRHDWEIHATDRDYMRALEKLKTKFTKRGNLDAANLVVEILGEAKAGKSTLADLCQIRVTSKTPVSTHPLNKNVQRLSGGYRPSFSYVSGDIEGARFIRVPWKSKPSYKIEVTAPGYLYMIGVGWNTFNEAGLKTTLVQDKLGGSHLGKLYAVYLPEGHVFECGGYESCLIAREIAID